MTDTHAPRLFPDDAAIRRVGEGMLARTLPRPEWTHEAHLATTAWLILERTDIAPERDLPHLIRAYNESDGGVNSDTEGYHETITQCFIRAVRLYLARAEPGLGWRRGSTACSARRRGGAIGRSASTSRKPCSRSRRGGGGWSRIWRCCRWCDGGRRCGSPRCIGSREGAKARRGSAGDGPAA